MAIQGVRQKEVFQKTKGSSLLDKAGAAASLIGAGVATYFTGGAAAPALAGSAINAQRTFTNTGSTQQVAPGARPEVLSAMDRRATSQQEDPLESLREAQSALASSGIDAKTRARLEAPILQAMQSQQRGRA